MSLARIGREIPEEELKKILDWWTEERRKEMSERMSGENNPGFGRKCTIGELEQRSKAISGENHWNYGKETFFNFNRFIFYRLC